MSLVGAILYIKLYTRYALPSRRNNKGEALPLQQEGMRVLVQVTPTHRAERKLMLTMLFP